MVKRWVLQETDPLKFARLQTSLNIHPVLLQLLVQRGISTFEEAKNSSGRVSPICMIRS